MTFLDLVKARRSVRKYAERPVEQEKIAYCLEAARLAPSACNKQPWEFVVVTNPQLVKEIGDTTASPAYSFNRFMLESPVVVVIVARRNPITHGVAAYVQGTQYYLIDIGIAGDHFSLAAAEKGLGTCWIGWFNEKKVKRILSLGRAQKVVAMLTLGYPQRDEVREKKRKPLDEMSRTL